MRLNKTTKIPDDCFHKKLKCIYNINEVQLSTVINKYLPHFLKLKEEGKLGFVVIVLNQRK